MGRRCHFGNPDNSRCGKAVSPKYDLRKKPKKTEYSFIEFITDGLCKRHGDQMAKSTRDPEILGLIADRQYLERRDARMAKAGGCS